MYQKLFEIDNYITAIYDDVHEYCTIEHVNEAYVRASIKKRRNSILKKMLQGFYCALLNIRSANHMMRAKKKRLSLLRSDKVS